MKKNNFSQIICFILFCIGTIIISCFHEPCFDEFQAWGISKDSIYNILFTIPHIEGHPPLWYLILKCFSHFNVNCELGIKIPNLLFMLAAVWLLIFKSPFPLVVRLSLPFTYFIFYQYSVINRPYSIFCFAIFLAALFYKEKNEHPFKFVLALALLCLSCAYGMAVSAGIIFVWFVELINSNKLSQFFKFFIKDKRFYAMLFILILCLGLIYIMYPDKDVLYSSSIQPLSFFSKLYNTFLIIPADSLFYNALNYNGGNLLKNNSIVILAGCFLGLCANILFFIIFKTYKKLLLFFIPYLIIFVIFLKYTAPHHIGLLTVFYIFAFWCTTSSSKENLLPEKLNKILIVFVSIVLIVQIYWNIAACFNEIKYPYLSARNIAKFIKENKIDNYKIMVKWLEPSYYRNKNTGEIIKGVPVSDTNEYFNNIFEKIEIINIHGQNICATINPYFNRNIFYAFNVEAPKKEYVIFKKMSSEEAEYTKQKIIEKGIPDFIINKANLWYIFDKEALKDANYGLLKEFTSYKIWKDKYTKSIHRIYIREDLFNKLYNLEKVNNEKK